MEAGAVKKEPKATEAKTGEDDLSMEEILQSIRRIIADDDNEGKKTVSPEKNGKGKAEEDVPGSDMLELTDMLKDDGTVVDLKKEAATAVAKGSVEAAPASYDILSQIDKALDGAEKLVEAPAAAVSAADLDAMFPASPPVTEPVVASAVAPVVAAPAPAAPAPADSLLSDAAAAATAEAFSRLKAAEMPAPVFAAPSGSPVFASGGTVESMVAEMLKPMLKQWLDANLPVIVQQIVEREVKKLTR